jgi:hypothetical protein
MTNDIAWRNEEARLWNKLMDSATYTRMREKDPKTGKMVSVSEVTKVARSWDLYKDWIKHVPAKLEHG